MILSHEQQVILGLVEKWLTQRMVMNKFAAEFCRMEETEMLEPPKLYNYSKAIARPKSPNNMGKLAYTTYTTRICYGNVCIHSVNFI